MSNEPSNKAPRPAVLSALAAIENNFGSQLPNGRMSKERYDFWVDFLSRWTDDDIGQTLRYVLEDCQFMPTVHDWQRLKPQRIETAQEYLGGIPAVLDKAIGTAPPFHKWMLTEIRATLKKIHKDPRRPLSPPQSTDIWITTYNKIADEAHHQNRPEDEAKFRNTATKMKKSLPERDTYIYGAPS